MILRAVAVAVGLTLALPARPEPASDHCAGGRRPVEAAPAPATSAAATRVELADVTLIDQDGRPVPLRALLGGGRLVVVDFVFTTCTTICPVLSAILARVQEALGERAGRDVLLVSVSLDPARDTPARLKAFGARFGAGPGWTWLTGRRADVDRALKGLGAYSADFAAHPPIILVGDGGAGRWVRLNGFPRHAEVLAQVEALLAARGGLAAKE